jgi:hypothetical protein
MHNASLLLLLVVIPKTDERNERLKVVILSSNIQTGSQVDKFQPLLKFKKDSSVKRFVKIAVLHFILICTANKRMITKSTPHSYRICTYGSVKPSYAADLLRTIK